MLVCVVHGWNDGLGANPNGEVHGVIISVPVSLMEKAGTYRFVLHFYDDYADSSRNHQVKVALEVNAVAQPLTFEVSTDPDGDSQQGHPGYDVGVRGSKKFYVIVKARLFWPGIAPPPFNTVRFLLIRSKTGERGVKTGFLVTDPKDPDGPKSQGNGYLWTFRTKDAIEGKVVYTHWIVTEKKGRWTVLISPPHRSNEVKFKIDKRKQIVLVAKSWVGATKAELGDSGLCWALAAKVYSHIGFPLPPSEQQYYLTVIDPTIMDGCLVFYSVRDPFDPAHVAIQVGLGLVVDINCNLGHPNDVQMHAAPIYAGGNQRKSPLELIVFGW